jgi:hypothetical protein
MGILASPHQPFLPSLQDRYCIDLGVLLDTGDATLLFPDRHSVHCLIDVTVCRKSEYEILGAPAVAGGMYSRAFTFDDTAKAGLIQLAARAGAMNPADAFPCRTCTEEDGILGKGFRAQVYGLVTALSTVPGVPHTIRVLDATASHTLPSGTACPDGATFPVQNPAFVNGTSTSGGGSAPTVAGAPTPAAATPVAAASPVAAAAPVAAASPVAAGGESSTTTDGS